jgi:hypothetical protein
MWPRTHLSDAEYLPSGSTAFHFPAFSTAVTWAQAAPLVKPFSSPGLCCEAANGYSSQLSLGTCGLVFQCVHSRGCRDLAFS